MAKAQKPLFESFGVPVVSTPDPTRPEQTQAHDADLDVHTPSVTDALETFLLGEGVEPPDVEPPPSPHADLWMLGPAPTYQRKIAFTESVGSRFGDIALTSRFCLDNWSQSPNGFRWTLDPGPEVVLNCSERAQDILNGCFVRTRNGLCKLAMAEHGGDVDGAIIQALREQMDLLGLDRYIPDEPEETW